MSNFSASIPSANMQVANAELEEAGHGPNNFSVPAYAGPSPTVALLHAWGDPVFEAAVAAIAGVTITQGTDPVAMTTEAAAAAGSTWGQNALPLTGTVSPGLYQDEDGVLWWVIQSYNTATYPNPALIPALIRLAKLPGELQPWQQPLDAYDAYKLVNSFSGLPDQCTHNGTTWTVTQADGSGNNVWEPGVFGWTGEGVIAPPAATWVDTGVTIAQLVGAGVYRVSAVLAGLTLGQALRLGDTAETVFNGYWPTAGTPSDYLKITPHVSADVGAKVWKWA